MNFLEYSAFYLLIHVLNPECDFSIKHRFYKKKKLVSAGQHFFLNPGG